MTHTTAMSACAPPVTRWSPCAFLRLYAKARINAESTCHSSLHTVAAAADRSSVDKSCSLRSGKRSAYAYTRCILCRTLDHDQLHCRCGHLYCWPCLAQWMQRQATCPVCKDHVDEERVIPIYTRNAPDPSGSPHTHAAQSAGIPPRPAGFRLLMPADAARTGEPPQGGGWWFQGREAHQRRPAARVVTGAGPGAVRPRAHRQHGNRGLWGWTAAFRALSPHHQAVLTQVLLLIGSLLMLFMLLW